MRYLLIRYILPIYITYIFNFLLEYVIFLVIFLPGRPAKLAPRCPRAHSRASRHDGLCLGHGGGPAKTIGNSQGNSQGNRQ